MWQKCLARRPVISGGVLCWFWEVMRHGFEGRNDPSFRFGNTLILQPPSRGKLHKSMGSERDLSAIICVTCVDKREGAEGSHGVLEVKLILLGVLIAPSATKKPLWNAVVLEKADQAKEVNAHRLLLRSQSNESGHVLATDSMEVL